MNKVNYFGIDLGTTNSVIAVYNAATGSNKAISLGNSTLLKSAISWSNGEIVVGTDTGTENTVKDVKSSIGDSSITYELGGRIFTPIDVSSMILKKLKDIAEEEYGEIKDITITVPAKFNHQQRTNTVLAAQKAGLNVISLINEPTAASLAYVDTEVADNKENILVYDLGGGTFDVSIVSIVPKTKRLCLPYFKIDLPEVNRQIVSVYISDGDINLGGNDLDSLIVEYALRGYQGTLTRSEYLELRKAAQKLKESGESVVCWEKASETKPILLTEDHLIEATNTIFERTMNITKSLMSIYPSLAIDRIVLVGGSTKNPYLRQNIKDWAGKIKVCHTINPDECVALGAAKNTFILQNDDAMTSFFDVSSDTVGVQVIKETGMKMERMIDKGTTLPTKFTRTFFKSSLEQTNLTIPIYQGENSNCKYNAFLGEVRIQDIPLDTSMREPIYCTFVMDKSGILTCTVKILDREGSVTLNSKVAVESVLSEQEKEVLSTLDDILETEEF